MDDAKNRPVAARIKKSWMFAEDKDSLKLKR